MQRKNYKVIFVSEESSSLKEFNFSRIKISFMFFLTGLTILSIAILGVDFMTNQLYNFRLKRLEDERLSFRTELAEIEKKAKSLQTEMETIIRHDDQMRTVVDLPEYDEDIRNVGIGGGAQPELSFSSFFSVEERLANNLLEDLDKLERQIDLETESFFEIQQAFERNKELARHYPSIRPVEGGRLTGRYGRRIHPITLLPDTHWGIDLSVPKGTPVRAPADGVIIKRKHMASMGRNIQIDHNEKEFGFRTSYGHLSKYNVKVGQVVKRGDIIGYVGSSGLATASHLHYEIFLNGKHVDPLSYYYDPSILY